MVSMVTEPKEPPLLSHLGFTKVSTAEVTFIFRTFLQKKCTQSTRLLLMQGLGQVVGKQCALVMRKYFEIILEDS